MTESFYESIRRIFFALALLLHVAFSGTSAVAVGPPSVVTAIAYEYHPGDHFAPDPQPLRLIEGGTLIFLNMDPLDYHTVTSVDVDDEHRPLFSTSSGVGIGQPAIVEGTEALPARAAPYGFSCMRHPWMAGDLYVVRANP